MNDQTQQQQGQPQSGQTPTSSSLATPKWNPWEGTPDPADQGSGSGGDDTQQTQQTPPTQQQPQPQVGRAFSQPAPAPQPGAAPQSGQQQQPEPGAQPHPQQPPPGLSPEAISELVAKTVAQAVPAMVPQPQQPQRQWTEQDFIRTFNVFQPTPEILAAVGLPNTPESVQAFGNISTAIVRQAVTMAAYQMEGLKKELTEHFQRTIAPYEPARKMAEERELEKMQNEFLAQHTDLKGYEPLLTEIRDRLISQGVRFKTKEEAFKTVAENARAILKQLPGFQQQNAGDAGQQQQQQGQSSNTNNGTHRMSGLSGSGQGGVGGARPAAGGGRKKTTAEELFGGR